MSTAATEFIRLVEVVARLRAPDGCPWDREQSIDSLKPFVLEETYEVLETIDRHDHAALREELGDFLYQAVFLAQLEADFPDALLLPIGTRPVRAERRTKSRSPRRGCGGRSSSDNARRRASGIAP